MKRLKLIRDWLPVISLGLAGLFHNALAENSKTDSRMPYHHVIPLRDAEDQMILLPPDVDDQGKPQDARANPFSTAQTCGRCHEYQSISQGWHFNAANPNVKPGRPGEPWILTDPATRTQIPLSYRGWKGTFKPAELGLSDYDFLKTFGRHFPGGGVGEPDKAKIDQTDAKARRPLVTGAMEIDCLICHNAHGDYDHEARAKAINNENFKWLPTIAAELGIYGGSRQGKALADSWKPPRPLPTNTPPSKYHRERFDLENHVTFAVTRRPSVNNCYYCHTSEAGVGDNRWHSDRDVHIRAGMSCIDCHRNGIDHMVVRGYEGEIQDRTITANSVAIRTKTVLQDHPELNEADAKTLAETQIKNELGRIETLSCRGCHYGSPEAKQPEMQLGGRLGAPFPEHPGIPPVHFAKLTCTACHSGPFPEDTTEIVHTSLAHKLGLPAPSRGENTAPVIVQSVFLRNDNGKIGPHKMVWPSYWGRLKDGQVKPLLPEEVASAAGDKLPTQTREEVERDPYNTKPLTDAQIKDVLTILDSEKTNGAAIFLAAGKMYQLDGANLKSGEHEAAKPYAWALAHDVRPASQSVGVKGCTDCHAKDSPIYFGTVAARGPVDPKASVSKPQWTWRGDNESAAAAFAFTFHFRTMLKILTFTCALIVFGVLLSHGLAGLNSITKRSARKTKDQ